MRNVKRKTKSRPEILPWVVLALSLAAALAYVLQNRAFAHCDTLDGPVVSAARIALEKGKPAPILKWVRPEHEAELSKAFKETLAVRRKGADVRQLADRYFFETAVRLHRAGEGEPYTGLKPAGAVQPCVADADAALKTGSVDALAQRLAGMVNGAIRQRYADVVALKEHADNDIEAGREFVEAYVEYIHFIEVTHAVASGEFYGHEDWIFIEESGDALQRP